MKRVITSIVALLYCGFISNAQMLENVDLEDGNNTVNTRLTGINNKGFVTGYTTDNSIERGFIISSTGRIIYIEPATVGTTNVRVEAINDNNVSIVVGQTGTTTTVYKCYFNVADDTISHLVAVNMSQPNALPQDINNKNDISGWYAGTQNFLFVKHDSIVPVGNNAWEARRVPDVLPNYFSTSGAGINDANKVSGWYIDGSNQAAMVYDNIAHTFNQLNSIYRIRLSDINNNGIVCGEYRQVSNNNTYMAFYGTPGTGTFTPLTTLLPIFQNGLIQSVASGINDNLDIVGSYLNPNTNRWNGFIYHVNKPEFRLPGNFTVQNNTWPMINSHGGTNPIWTSAYYNGADYDTQDPYANNGLPLITNIITSTHQITDLPDTMSPTWKGFAKECDENGAGLSTNTNQQDYYKTILKYKLFDKWYPKTNKGFKGYCYGFTTTSLQRFYEDGNFSSWFNMPAGTNISQVNNTDLIAVQAIERSQLKQFDKRVVKKNEFGRWIWEGLYGLKTEYSKTSQLTNPTNLTIQIGTNSWHSVLPYKIRTPRTLPLTARDTLFYYDPNEPGDSTNYILAGSIYYYMENAANGMSCPSYPGLKCMIFPFTGVRFMNTIQHSQMKSTSAVVYDDMYTFSLLKDCYYNISRNGNLEAKVDASGYANDSLDVAPLLRYDQDDPICEHVVDSGTTINTTTYNYAGNAMILNQVNNARSMGLSRIAQQSEMDHSTQKNAMIIYGNPDNISKTLAAFMRETQDDMQQGANIIVTNICADPGDSIVTRSPAPYVYNITKVNGTNNCTYHLTVYAAYNGEINEFHGDAVIEPNSSHTIDPYYVGSNGTQVAVIVDNGNDGTADDTLFVAGWPVNIKSPIKDGNIKVYPNPVSDKLSIELAGNYDSYDIRLTDIVGKAVYSTTSKKGKLNVSMNTLASGMYLLQITDNKGHILYLDKITKQ